MRSIALVCLMALAAFPAAAQQPADPDDSFEMNGTGPKLLPTVSTTLRALKEDIAEHRPGLDGMLTIDGLRISNCRKYDNAPGEAAYVFDVYERSTSESTSARPYHGEVFFGATEFSVGEKIRANPRLERYPARVRFVLVAIPDEPSKPYYLALVSSVEWVDANGRIIDTAH